MVGRNSDAYDEVDADGVRTYLNILCQDLILISTVCLNKV